MSTFEKIFEKLARYDDPSIIFTNWLDYVIDQNLFTTHKRELDFKGNEQEYFNIFVEWVIFFMKNIPGTKHVCKDKTGFSVYKWINGKQKHLGHAKTLIIALMIRDWCKANNWKPYPGNMMKYIYQDKRTGHYQILKQHVKNGKKSSKHFGSFKTLEEAQEYRDLCVEKDWDEQLMPCNNPTVINPLKYIQKTPAGNYRIGKWENGKSVHYGTYLTLFDAIQERDLLMKHNWDFELVCNEDERLVDETIFNGRRVDY